VPGLLEMDQGHDGEQVPHVEAVRGGIVPGVGRNLLLRKEAAHLVFIRDLLQKTPLFQGIKNIIHLICLYTDLISTSGESPFRPDSNTAFCPAPVYISG